MARKKSVTKESAPATEKKSGAKKKGDKKGKRPVFSIIDPVM